MAEPARATASPDPEPRQASPDPANRRAILPSVASVLQSGAFGAALGAMTAGVVETCRVKNGEIDSDEAVRNVIKSSAQGAATMAVATVASQIVRSHPVFGVIALTVAAVGAYVTLSAPAAKSGSAPAGPAPQPRTEQATVPAGSE